MNKKDIEGLKFIKEVLEGLDPNPDRYDWGPSFDFAKRDKKLALQKLQTMIEKKK